MADRPSQRREAYLLANANDGVPGIDRVTFPGVEAGGSEKFLDQVREELEQQTYRPQRARKVEIPKGGGKLRQLSIPSIRDRVVQGALKLILEPIFEADFQPGSFGYRPRHLESAFLIHPILGRKEDSAPSGPGVPASRFRLEAVERGMAVRNARALLGGLPMGSRSRQSLRSDSSHNP